MPVDPQQDVDICITCLTKTPPKLPLREELPSLGVELIYKARGVGAKISKHEAHRAARDFRDKESMKDLKKRRLFPKSSRRIRDLLEERRRCESEIKHRNSAVSYESYQHELYGGWATDSTGSYSSRDRKHHQRHPLSSSDDCSSSSVSDIRTGAGNRRMTKMALKRWRLFRKKSTQRRKARLREERKRQQEKKKAHSIANQQCSTMGSFLGEDLFADFLAPLPRVGEDDVADEPYSHARISSSKPQSQQQQQPNSGSSNINKRRPTARKSQPVSVDSASLDSSSSSSSSAFKMSESSWAWDFPDSADTRVQHQTLHQAAQATAPAKTKIKGNRSTNGKVHSSGAATANNVPWYAQVVEAEEASEESSEEEGHTEPLAYVKSSGAAGGGRPRRCGEDRSNIPSSVSQKDAENSKKHTPGSSAYSRASKKSWSSPSSGSTDTQVPSKESDSLPSHDEHLSPVLEEKLQKARRESSYNETSISPTSGRPDNSHYGQQEYPDAKSPPAFPSLKSPKDNTKTPNTTATSPTTPGYDDSIVESPSTFSSLTESHYKTRREKLLDGSNKLSRYLSRRKDRLQEASHKHEPCIEESESKESNSDTSLIGLSVAFPKEESLLDDVPGHLSANNQTLPAPAVDEVDDTYISEDSDSKNPDDVVQQLDENEETSGVFDQVPTSVHGPTKTYSSWKDTSLLGMGGPSQETKQNNGTALDKNARIASPVFDNIPDDLYEAFGRNKQDTSKKARQDQITSEKTAQSTNVSDAWDLVMPKSDALPDSRQTADVISSGPAVQGQKSSLKVNISAASTKLSNAWDLVLKKTRSSETATSPEGQESFPNTEKTNSTISGFQASQQENTTFETDRSLTEIIDRLEEKTSTDDKDKPNSKKKNRFKLSMPRVKTTSAKSKDQGSRESLAVDGQSHNQDIVGEGASDETVATEPDEYAEGPFNPLFDHNVNWWEAILPDIESSGARSSSNGQGVSLESGQQRSQNPVESRTIQDLDSKWDGLNSIEMNKTFPKLDDSAAQAFVNIPEDFYGAWLPAARKGKDTTSVVGDDDERSLKHVVREEHIRLTQYETRIDEIMDVVAEDPTLVQIKEEENGQMLLHRFASSPFPFHVEGDDFIDMLLDDIHIFRGKLDLIFNAFPAASEVVDADGDLPVHLLARNLMQWETTWYARVYEKASKESGNGPATKAITDLYFTMSLCIETLLCRVVKDGILCRERGSMGSLLPLHIATIFTSSVKTLRDALESYPEGALEACWIKGFDTFVPDGALPIEIHDAFCTDFPKWEVEVWGPSDLKWSQRRNEGEATLDDSVRRSDLLFAYNPSIQRFWKDRDRIRRIEHKINFEAKKVAETNREDISKAGKRAWIWMCTFTGIGGARGVLSGSVARIIEDLPLSLIRMLASMPTSSGEPIIDVAHKDCVSVIRQRLDDISVDITPIATFSDASKTTASKVLQSWDETQQAILSQYGKISLGQVCRAIFNVQERKIPTSFVILPYRLARNANGTLGMSSAESASIAVRFAECLLKLTDPRSVLYYVDKKSDSYFGVSMYEGADNEVERQKAFNYVIEVEKSLLELYVERVAYLYLLDEETGVPLVPRSDEVYPMVLTEPASIVRKLLPIMILGMIQMRGDKALSVMSTVLLDATINIVPSHYEEAAKKLKVYIYKKVHDKEKSDPIRELPYIKNELNRFLYSFKSKKHRSHDTMTGTSEWNVELSILQMLFEVNDPRSTFSGLIMDKTSKGETRWIRDAAFESSGPIVKRQEPQVYVYADRQVAAKYGLDSFSQGDNVSHSGSHTTLAFDPLKFHQPPDDSTATTFETQASPNLAASQDDVALRTTDSIESTESERIKSKHNLINEVFAVDEIDESVQIKDIKATGNPKGWNPAEQVWVDVNNRLEVTNFFWDEAQVTNLRVGLAQQANKLCLLQQRIKEIKHDENKHAQRVHELLCRLMGDNPNVLEVPSPRSLFGIRKLLTRLNDLESRLAENEIDSQHISIRAGTLNEELFDLIPLIEEELSDTSSSERSSSSSSRRQSFDDSRKSGIIMSDEPESDEIDCERSAIISESTRQPGVESSSSRLESMLSHEEVPENITSAEWTKRIRRLRETFAAAHRENASNLSQYSPCDERGTNTSTLTDSCSSTSDLVRERITAARAVAKSGTPFPFDIALPALDHQEDSKKAQAEIVQKSNDSSSSKSASSKESSSAYEENSCVHYDKKTGQIEF